MLPYGAREVVEVRKRGMRPAGGITLTDDWRTAKREAAKGWAVCILPRYEDWAALDLRFCVALDVFVAHRERSSVRLKALGEKLMEVTPRSVWFCNLTTKEPGGYVVEPPCKS